MDLKSGYPYWTVKNGLMYSFPKLDADLSCDVAVEGAGITGALIADELAGHGHCVVVLDQREVSWGSTSASTALLQYEIDTHAINLAKRCDQASALLAYQSCLRTISEVGAVAHAVSRLFPHLHAQPAFAWACTFAETSDGLPLFGHHQQYGPRVLFALAYGGVKMASLTACLALDCSARRSNIASIH
ncbi:MAG: FAD-dependent oxidoreductase [Desulfobacterales bacterium]